MDNMQVTIDHYNKYTPLYYKVCGSIIESYVSKNPRDILTFIGSKVKLNTDDKVLDAGCGFGGPALYFANTFRSNILGININKQQLNVANELKDASKLSNLNFKFHDFHKLSKLNMKFNKILFIESIGHSNDLSKVLEESYKSLNDNGIVFIKTFFSLNNSPEVERNVQNFYGYSTYKEERFIQTIEKHNFDIVEFNSFPDIDLDSNISERFENEAGVDISYLRKGRNPFSVWKYIILKKLEG